MTKKIRKRTTTRRFKKKNRKMTRKRTHTKKTHKKMKRTHKKMKRIQRGGAQSSAWGEDMVDSSKIAGPRLSAIDALRLLEQESEGFVMSKASGGSRRFFSSEELDPRLELLLFEEEEEEDEEEMRKSPLLPERFESLEHGTTILSQASKHNVTGYFDYDNLFMYRLIEARMMAENYKYKMSELSSRTTLSEWRNLLKHVDLKIKKYIKGELPLAIESRDSDRLAAALNMVEKSLYQEDEELQKLVTRGWRAINEIASEEERKKKDDLISLIVEKMVVGGAGGEEEKDLARRKGLLLSQLGLEDLSETALRKQAASLGVEPYATIAREAKEKEEGEKVAREAREARQAQEAEEESRLIEWENMKKQAGSRVLII